jgi:hypothetical protein
LFPGILFAGLEQNKTFLIPVSTDAVVSPRTDLPGMVVDSQYLSYSFWKKYNYEAGLMYSLIKYEGLHGIRVSMEKDKWGRENHLGGFPLAYLFGKGGWGMEIGYVYSDAPLISKEYEFLKDNGISVRRIITEVYVEEYDSTYTYTTDKIQDFKTKVQILKIAYIRNLNKNDEFKIKGIFAVPVIYHKYTVKCTLENGQEYVDSDSRFGAGLSAGLLVSIGPGVQFNQGISLTIGAVYEHFWFNNPSDKKLSKPFRKELNGFEVFVTLGWRFKFYK